MIEFPQSVIPKALVLPKLDCKIGCEVMIRKIVIQNTNQN